MPPLETPPLARGRRNAAVPAEGKVGNTPACAGKTMADLAKIRVLWKHPRLRGEDGAWILACVGQLETPPLARGRQTAVIVRVRHDGNTPACAGKTSPRTPRFTCSRRKHPRLRGEDALRPLDIHRSGGNTPACAGKTSGRDRTGYAVQKHPRLRGEDYAKTPKKGVFGETPPLARGRLGQYVHYVDDLRNTPACAGKTVGWD